MADKVEKRVGRKRRRREKENGVMDQNEEKKERRNEDVEKELNFFSCSVPGLYQYCAGDNIEKNEMGGACSAYRGKERRIQSFGGET